MQPVAQKFFTYTFDDREIIESYCTQVETSMAGKTDRSSTAPGISFSAPVSPATPSVAPVTFVDNSHYHDSSVHIASGNTIGNTTSINPQPNQPRSKEEEEEKQKREAARTAAYTGGIFAILASPILAFVGRRYQTAQKNNEATQKMLSLKDNHPTRENYYLHQHPVYANLEIMANIQKGYDQDQLNKAKKDLTATIIFLGSSIALGLGGLYRKEEIMKLGIIGVIAGVALGLFSVAWHWNSDRRTQHNFNELDLRMIYIRNYMETIPDWNALTQPVFMPLPQAYSAYPQMYPPTTNFTPPYAPGT